MDLSNYVKPELLVVAVVLCILGAALNKTGVVSCRILPFLNGAAGIGICALYVFATTEVSGAADIAMAVFTSLTQGILVSGLATVVCRVTGKEKNTDPENKKTDQEAKGMQNLDSPDNTKDPDDSTDTKKSS